MAELRAIMKALGHHPTDDDLVQVLGGDPKAEVDLKTVQDAMRERGHTATTASAVGSPGWQRSRVDSHANANKFSSVGGAPKGSKLDLMRRRTRGLMMVQRLSGGSSSKSVDTADGTPRSRLEGEYAGLGGDDEATKNALALAEEELAALQKCLDGLDTGASSDAAKPAATLRRLISGTMSQDLAKGARMATAQLTSGQEAPSEEDIAARQLLGRAVQDLCEVKVLLSEADGDKDTLEYEKHLLEARNYELETDKSDLYATVLETKLNLAQAEMDRQKLTISLKRERQHRDALGQRIAALELRLAAVSANRRSAADVETTGEASGRAPGVRARRRAEVGVQLEYEEDDIFEAPVIPKNSKSREFIRQAIRSVDLFNHLQPEQCKLIIGAMSRADYREGDTIVARDELASHFYVLEAGQCTVETSDGDVFVLAHGSSFGESSMLRQTISARTISARTKCLLWRLERSVYLGIVVRTTAQRKAKYEKLLGRVSLLRQTTPIERSLVADSLKAHHVRADEVVINIGEKGEYFYIIVKGTLKVLDKVGTELAQRMEGQYFGEKALLTDEPRGATIQAMTDCELARVDKKTFVRLVGALQELNFREYNGEDSGGSEKSERTPRERLQAEKSKLSQAAFEPLPPSAEIRKQDQKLVAFETLGQLGRGAFGVVCLVRYRLNNKCYAVKAINKRMVVQKKHVTKVVRERENLALCASSPAASKGIVGFHAAFQDERNLYLAMEYLPGGELFSLLPLKPREVKLVLAQVTLTLIAIHDTGVIHRDLKPENLLVNREGHVKLVDFGLSKRVVDRTFTFCGTPDYMAPEIIQNLGHNKAVDYWALGCLLFEMFVGDAPFYRPGGEAKVTDRILRNKVRRPASFRLRTWFDT